jgi:chorismate mutase
MNDHESTPLRGAVEEAIALLRSHSSPLRAALVPLTESLESLCASLQQKVGHAPPEDVHAAVLVLTRDLVATAAEKIEREADVDSRAVMLALATLHNRIAAALESCAAVPVGH